MSHRQQLGFLPTPAEARRMEGGRLKIAVDKSRGPGKGKVIVDMDNVLGIQNALDKLTDFFTMDGAGPSSRAAPPKPKSKKPKSKKK
jgi:hypothetical protein